MNRYSARKTNSVIPEMSSRWSGYSDTTTTTTATTTGTDKTTTDSDNMDCPKSGTTATAGDLFISYPHLGKISKFKIFDKKSLKTLEN